MFLRLHQRPRAQDIIFTIELKNLLNSRMTSIRSSLFAIISHGNATQKGEIIGSNSYTSLSTIPNVTMKPALAQTPASNTLEDLGRATVQIVHDLKNQLNG